MTHAFSASGGDWADDWGSDAAGVRDVWTGSGG